MTNIAIENYHSLIGKPSINGQFSMAMLNNQRVTMIVIVMRVIRHVINKHCIFDDLFHDFVVKLGMVDPISVY